MSRRIMKPQIFKITDPIPDELTGIDQFDYFYAMLSSLAKMMTHPEARTLRQIVWLAKIEAGRILEEARSSQASEGGAAGDKQGQADLADFRRHDAAPASVASRRCG